MNTHESIPHVTMDPLVHLPSTWKDAKGKLLTNRRIGELAAMGHYGKAAQQRQLLKIDHRHQKQSEAGVIFRCACDETVGIKYLTWAYLPKPGWYCPRCLAAYREDRERPKLLAKQLAERVRKEYI